MTQLVRQKWLLVLAAINVAFAAGVLALVALFAHGRRDAASVEALRDADVRGLQVNVKNLRAGLASAQAELASAQAERLLASQQQLLVLQSLKPRESPAATKAGPARARRNRRTTRPARLQAKGCPAP